MSLGTASENMQDKIRDGTLLNGENSPVSIITEDTARKIILSKFDKNHPEYKTQDERAKMFSVETHLISSIDKGNSWGHLRTEEERKVIDKKNKKRRERIKRIRREQKKNGLTNDVLNFLKM